MLHDMGILYAGRCVILICNGQRTMRTCLGEAARMMVNDLSVQDFTGAKLLLLSGYCFYSEGLLQRAIDLATEANVKVALDLASFEVVKSFKQELKHMLQGGNIHCCFCNEVSPSSPVHFKSESASNAAIAVHSHLCTHLQLASQYPRYTLPCLAKQHCAASAAASVCVA